jgi:hypothetical protein
MFFRKSKLEATVEQLKIECEILKSNAAIAKRVHENKLVDLKINNQYMLSLLGKYKVEVYAFGHYHLTEVFEHDDFSGNAFGCGQHTSEQKADLAIKNNEIEVCDPRTGNVTIPKHNINSYRKIKV